MVKLPGELGWLQNNRGDTLGTIYESFNIDLESNIGRVRTTRTKLVASGDGTLGQIGPVVAITYFQNLIRVFTGSADNQYNGGNSPFDSLTRDESSVAAGIDEGDAVVFNNAIYVSTDTDIEKSALGDTYSSISATLTANVPHLMCVYNDRLYVSDDDGVVYSVSTGDAVATSGANTLDLNLPGYVITALMAGEDRIWIALTQQNQPGGNQKALIYEWDGVTENAPNRSYTIDAKGVMCGIVKDDLPYFLDTQGRLMAFNGGAFLEVGRLPNMQEFDNPTAGDNDSRAIHPRGIDVDGDEILINIANLRDGSSGSSSQFNDFPSGVWAWSQRHGFYHKLSPSYQDVGDTGTTNLTDFGQYRCYRAGPLKVFEVNNPSSSDGGRVMFGMAYFTDADDGSTDVTYGALGS